MNAMHALVREGFLTAEEFERKALEVARALDGLRVSQAEAVLGRAGELVAQTARFSAASAEFGAEMQGFAAAFPATGRPPRP